MRGHESLQRTVRTSRVECLEDNGSAVAMRGTHSAAAPSFRYSALNWKKNAAEKSHTATATRNQGVREFAKSLSRGFPHPLSFLQHVKLDFCPRDWNRLTAFLPCKVIVTWVKDEWRKRGGPWHHVQARAGRNRYTQHCRRSWPRSKAGLVPT